MNKQDFLTSCELEVTTLDIWLEQSWLLPDASGAEISFSEIDIARVRFIRDLQGDLGVNDQGVDVILHLVDQLHGLRGAMEQLRKDSKSGSATG